MALGRKGVIWALGMVMVLAVLSFTLVHIISAKLEQDLTLHGPQLQDHLQDHFPEQRLQADHAQEQDEHEAPQAAKADLQAEARTIALNVTAEVLPEGEARLGHGNSLVFLRVQKVAGTTLERILEQQCGRHNWSCDWNWHQDWNNIMQRHQGKRIVYFIRDPVERVYSEYLFLSKQSHQPAPQGMPQWDYTPEQAALLSLQHLESLEDFLELPDNPVHNRAARYLLGFHRPYIYLCLQDCQAWWSDFLASEVAPGGSVREAKEAGWTEQQLLEILKGRLERVELGLAECFDASVQLLARRFDWPERAMLKVAKTHFRADGANQVSQTTKRHRDELTEEQVSQIEQLNSLDLLLHRAAKEVFQRRLASAGLAC